MSNLTAEQFLSTAKPITVKVAGRVIAATPRKFSTGSLGFYASAKVPAAESIEVCGTTFPTTPRAFSTGSTGSRVNGKVAADVAGTPCILQLSGNLVEIGSKKGAGTGVYQLGLNLVIVGSKNANQA